MPARHRSRERAREVVVVWDLRKEVIEEAISSFYETLGSDEDDPKPTPVDEFMESLVRGTAANAETIDQRITAKSANWRLERMPVVDRNILRLAVYEINDLKTPGAVAIDEALELARQFSADESVSFINRLFDPLHRTPNP